MKNQVKVKENKKQPENNNNFIEQKVIFSNNFSKQKEEVATSLFQSATEQVSKSWYEKFICGLE